jgi:Family of unknown function (DUF6502)
MAGTSKDLKRAALAAFRMLVRPIASLMLRCGITWKELSEELRLVYVAAATDDFGRHGRPANISRVAILTGIGRREVRRARDQLQRGADSPPLVLERMSRATRILSGWHQDAEFVDAKGRPRLLGIDGPKGFEGLARRYAPDLPVGAMLKELKQVGAVHETASGRVRAVARTFIPAPLDPDAVIRAGEVVGDLARTISHNLTEPDRQSRFERRATNRNVARVSRRAFDRFVEARGMDFLEEVDEWLSEHEAGDTIARRARLGVGVYIITED